MRFNPGRVVATPNYLSQAEEHGVSTLELLNRHLTGDWGDVCKDDAKENERALKQGNRIMSVYKEGDIKVWVITEADRSVTTFLMPEDY